MPKTLTEILKPSLSDLVRRADKVEIRTSEEIPALVISIQKAVRDVLAAELEDFKRKVSLLQGPPGSPGVQGESVRGAKGEKGEKGDKGDFIIGSQGLPGKDGSPDMPEEVRDKLQTLKGEERLDASAIKNIERYIPKVIERKQKQIHGGGASLEFEVPVGTVDGSNTSFTVNRLPKASLFLFFVNGQLLKASGEDYTLSARTVSLNTPPPTGSILLCLYAK